MTSCHERVSCDLCRKTNFRGLRYKCLVCYDYDLCSKCYEAGLTSSRHTTNHPMQCIIAKNDYELFYAGETDTSEHGIQSLTCPLCGHLGLTETTLLEHVNIEHSTSSDIDEISAGVVCPICGSETNQLTYDFATHLNMEHRPPRDTSSSSLATSSTSTTVTSGQGHRVSRGIRCGTHLVPRFRRLHLNSNATFNSSSSNNNNNNHNINSNSNISSNSGSNTTNNNNSQHIPAVSNLRDCATDPLVEILAQLSGLRRAGANQSLQMHLSQASLPIFSSSGSSNDRELRLMRRTFNQLSSLTSSSSSSDANAMTSNTNTGANLSGLDQICLVNQSSFMVGTLQQESNDLAINDSHSNINNNNMTNPGVIGSPVINYLCSQPGDSPAKQTNCELQQTQFLLPKCMKPNLSEAEQQQKEILRADRSLFVQDLLLQIGLL